MVDNPPHGTLKTRLIFPLFLCGVAVLVGRLYNIQIQNHHYLLKLAKKQSEITTEVPARRGTIFDCNRRVLTVSLERPAVFADPGIVAVPARARRWLPRTLGVPTAEFKKFLAASPPDVIDDVTDPTLKRLVNVTKRLADYLRTPPELLLRRLRTATDARLRGAAQKLSPVLGIPEPDLRRALRRDTRFAWLKRRVSEATARRIKQLNIRGICVREQQARTAPPGLKIGQWLGLVGTNGHGLEGLELFHDRRLRGTPGLAQLGRDARGNGIADSAEPAVPPKDGCNLYLTVDRRAQRILDGELERTFAQFSPGSVSGIVMEPSTGRIVAMGSAPGLDAARVHGLSREELRRRLRNHPIQSIYEYGSTFKPLVAAAAIDLGLVTPDSPIQCENGRWKYRGRLLHDHHPYGKLSVTDVIVHSSNIGAAKLGLMLGADRLQQLVSFYHFGRKSGIKLPGEASGMVTPARRWTYYTTTSVPIGQEIAGTPLQLTAAFCSLINGGRLMQPYIVEAIEDPNTNDLTRRTPKELERVISPETSAKMRRILAQVVERGTGKQLRNANYQIGGKTGTAQKVNPDGGYSQHSYVASFVGFAPVSRPRICVLVLVDEPKGSYYGSQVAAPAVGRIIDKTLAILDAAAPKTRTATRAFLKNAGDQNRSTTSNRERRG